MENLDQNEDKKEAHLHSQVSHSTLREKIKTWLNDPYHLALVGILIFALAILLYYFNITKNQPLWWDESEYMSIAKTWAFNIPYDINPQRPPLFPFLAAILFKVGLSELSIKFLLEIIPALLIILFTFILISEMYNKKVGLIAAFITSVSWIHIFYTMRLMTDALGLLFGILAFLCFWKGWIKKQGDKYLLWIGFFVALSFMCRLTGILYGASIVLFLLLTLQFDALKNKSMWLVPVVFLLTISPYLIWSYLHFNNAVAFFSGYGGIMYDTLGWQMLNHVYDFPELVFFIFFLVGLVVISPIFLILDRVIMKKEKEYYADFFMIISIIFILFFFIYFLRLGENRWLILMSIGIFAISAKGILWVYNLVLKNINKTMAITVILLILFSGAYFQLKHADSIIKGKVDSYMPVKQAGLWLKDNYPKDTKVLSISYPQTVYYSELNVSTYSTVPNESAFNDYLTKNKPQILEVSAFEPLPKWVNGWLTANQNRTRAVQAYYQDAQKQQPILIVYQLSY